MSEWKELRDTIVSVANISAISADEAAVMIKTVERVHTNTGVTNGKALLEEMIKYGMESTDAVLAVALYVVTLQHIREDKE